MKNPIGLFEAYGIEIELMIVDAKTLDVTPAADRLLAAAAGELVSDYEDGDITWSNELVSHVIEFKTTEPARDLESLASSFLRSQRHARHILARHGCRLMPTGMHPWMNPQTETVLWPHENSEIYSLYDSIFDCRGHGWSNLQSMHINLPFASEDEFNRLHSAIRLILPILPALGASTPFCDGRSTGLKDTRLAHYETNQRRLPIIAGDVIPVAVRGFDDYREKISNPIQDAIRPHDPSGLLQGDWLNSRGAIARTDRGTIEIRLLDTQECAQADLTLVQFVVAALQSLVFDDDLLASADRLDTQSLFSIWKSCVKDAEHTPISDSPYLELLTRSLRYKSTYRPSYRSSNERASMTKTAQSRHGDDSNGRKNENSVSAIEIWRHLYETRIRPTPASQTQQRRTFEDLLSRPSLATRIQTAAGNRPTRTHLRQIYEKLCDCLDKNEIFDPKSRQAEKHHEPSRQIAASRENSDTAFNL